MTRHLPSPNGALDEHRLDGPMSRWGSGGIEDVLGLIRRNRWIVFLATATVVVATEFFTARLTPIFEGRASIRVDDSLAAQANPFSLAVGSELTTEVEMLRSRTLAEAVVRQLGTQVELVEPRRHERREFLEVFSVSEDAAAGRLHFERGLDGRFAVRDSTGQVLETLTPEREAEVGGARVRLRPEAIEVSEFEVSIAPFPEAVQLLQSNLIVGQRGGDARIVDVRYESPDPGLAQDVPNELARQFILDRQSVQQSQARSTVSFLQEQIDLIATQLATAESELREFRETERVISIAEQGSSEVRRAAELQAQLSSLQAESSSLTKLLEEVRAEAAGSAPGSPSPLRRLIGFPTLMRNEAASSLLGSMVATEDRRAELLTRRSLQDSEVQSLTLRIRQLEEQLEDISATYLSGLNNQMVSLEAALARTGQTMAALPAKEARYGELERDARLLENIYNELQSRLKEGEIAAAVQDPSVRLVDAAIAPVTPVRPKPMINLSLALITGLLLGVSAAYGRERADKSVRTRRDVLHATGLPVLGLVPRATGSARASSLEAPGGRLSRLASGLGVASYFDRQAGTRAPSLAKHPVVIGLDPWTPFAEAYNRLETNVAFAANGSSTKLLVVTSPLPGDGKTTSSVNFAITLSQRGKRVLLVDADLRRGVLHTLFRTAREPGLSDVVTGTAELWQAVRRVSTSGGSHLAIMPAGTVPSNPAQLIRSGGMKALLQQLRGDFDFVVLDAPPLNLVTDSALLGAESDGVIVVARAGVTTGDALSFTMEQLNHVQAPVLGAILNDIDFRRDLLYDRSYQYYARYEEYGRRHGRS